MSDMDALMGDIAALQQRLRDAGLDDSLPSKAASKAAPAKAAAPESDRPAAASGAAVEGYKIAKPEKAVADKFVKELEEDDRTPDELAAVKAAAEAMDHEKVAALKAEGNEFFRKNEFKEANVAYLAAIRMLDKGDMADAKLLSNMAASQLALDKFVAAAMYGQRCIEADGDWWKGHWYRGQALMKMLRNKPPSTAMSERCEQAKFAFEGCLKTSTLPASKRPQVEEELQACKNALMQITGCGQS